MGIKLFAEPHISPVSWKKFIKEAPNNSVAIDGYVSDSTKFYEKRIIANFNHHENVNRLATKATCAQVLMAIRMGFMDYYRSENGDLEMNIFTNDYDQDVCLTIFLLKYAYMAEHSINPSLNRLVFIEDCLDSTSGTYPVHKDSPILKELAWVFEPCYRAMFNGQKTSELCLSVIADVEHRILAHITGRGEKVNLDTRYKIIGGGAKWKLVEQLGMNARTGMISDGITCYVLAKQREDGNWNYTIGKTSPFIPGFKVDFILNSLNKVENLTDDRWGGSDIIGGSPRVNGSSLSPIEIEKIINNLIERNFKDF